MNERNNLVGFSGSVEANRLGIGPDQASRVAQEIADAVAAEREACAKVAEHLNGWGSSPAPDLAEHIAAAIRARSK